MTVHTQAVAYSVGEVFVGRAVACVDDYFACGGVYGTGGDPGFSLLQGGALGTVDSVEDLLHFVSRLAQDEGAADVGLVALHVAAVIDQDDGTFADDLRLDGAVRER